MAYRTLEITLISAQDLKDVNLFSRMEVYAVAFLSGDPRSKQRTPSDRHGGRNPTWNSTLRFTIPAGDPGPLVLHVILRTERVLGDRDVGEVYIPLKDLLSFSTDGPSTVQFASYQVRKPYSHKTKGVLNLSYKLSEKITPPVYPPSAKPMMSEEPVMAYPVAASSAAYPPPYVSAPPYPPPPYGYAPPPPQAGYGYPPAGYGYVAPPPPPVVQPARRNNGFGMGLGAGLLGGALGGLLIGDIISDDAAAYDAGFDDGNYDAGGFDF